MQNDSKIYLISGIIVAVALIGSIIYFAKDSGGPGKLDGFATCLKDQGAIFYGAFWCPHCQATKRLFGNSAKKLPYVECSEADGNSQTQVCKDKKIENYPTWIFKDGSQLHGEVTLEQLAEKTSCSIYAVEASSTPVTATSSLVSATSTKTSTK